MKTLPIFLFAAGVICGGCSSEENAIAEVSPETQVNAPSGTASTTTVGAVAANPGLEVAASHVDDAAAACAACHNGMIDLSDVPLDELASLIQEIAAGNQQHPTPMPKLSAEELQDLAAQLQAL